MPSKVKKAVEEVPQVAVEVNGKQETLNVNAAEALVQALVQAITLTKPVEKKTAATFKSKSAFHPKDGSTRAKLKRKSYHHGVLINRDNGHEIISNEEIELFNKIRPGKYCGGYVTVTRRRDKGIDIDYPIRTASQRLRLVNEFGIRSFKELLERIVHEQENPTQYKTEEDDE